MAKPMFGLVACYVGGRLVVVLADRREPWAGLLFPTERPRQAAVLEEFPELRVHPVLGKWLWLPNGGPFAATATRLIARIESGDERFGVEPEGPRLPRYPFGGGASVGRGRRARRGR